MSAGDKRALLGCGGILAVIVGLFVAFVMWSRSTGGAQGEPCEDSSDCKAGFLCADDVYAVVQTVCRQKCDTHADCPGGTCLDVLDAEYGLCQ
jgi:hypothetical protein